MRRRSVKTAACSVVVLAVSLLSASPADAATGQVATSGVALNVRSGPGASYAVVGSLAPGTTVSFDCYLSGTAVTGPWGTESVWDHLAGGGYVADAWIYTGSNAAVVPVCGSGGSFQYRVAWTGIGIYPRAGVSMGSAKVGAALADGTLVQLACETYGETETDTAGYTNNIWDQLTNGTYLPNVYLNTGTNGRTPGLATCASAPPPPVQQSPRPTGNIAVPAQVTFPRKRQPKVGAPPLGWAALLASCAAFHRLSWPVANSMCLHYVGASGTTYSLNMGDLIWSERPLWSSLEWHLRNQVALSYAALKATPSSAAASRPFDSGWKIYTATKGDWAEALHSFSFRVVGDMWIGPADASGARPIQIRYRSAMYDVYDFANSGYQRQFYDVATKGWAAEFSVLGNTRIRVDNSSTTQLAPWSLPFEW